MYRGVAYAYMQEVKSGSELRAPSPELDMDAFLKSLDIRFVFGETAKVFFNGDEISEKIRDPKISLLASRLSQKRKVRVYLTGKQREIGKDGGVVLEGRDTGSVVFPDANMKFYLDADKDERAKRRHLELSSKGVKSVLSVVKEEMLKRDRDDSERDIAPLTIPEHAIYIDTTGLDANGVVAAMLKFIVGSGI